MASRFGLDAAQGCRSTCRCSGRLKSPWAGGCRPEQRHADRQPRATSNPHRLVISPLMLPSLTSTIIMPGTPASPSRPKLLQLLGPSPDHVLIVLDDPTLHVVVQAQVVRHLGRVGEPQAIEEDVVPPRLRPDVVAIEEGTHHRLARGVSVQIKPLESERPQVDGHVHLRILIQCRLQSAARCAGQSSRG